jgi:hypothetical protein
MTFAKAWEQHNAKTLHEWDAYTGDEKMLDALIERQERRREALLKRFFITL